LAQLGSFALAMTGIEGKSVLPQYASTRRCSASLI